MRSRPGSHGHPVFNDLKAPTSHALGSKMRATDRKSDKPLTDESLGLKEEGPFHPSLWYDGCMGKKDYLQCLEGKGIRGKEKEAPGHPGRQRVAKALKRKYGVQEVYLFGPLYGGPILMALVPILTFSLKGWRMKILRDPGGYFHPLLSFRVDLIRL